jgi:hypothetical protein
MASRQAKIHPPTKPTVIGRGLVALDVVIADDVTVDPILCAGGTCGNVLTALALLGWASYPIARLRSDAASKRVIEDPTGVLPESLSDTKSSFTPHVFRRRTAHYQER